MANNIQPIVPAVERVLNILEYIFEKKRPVSIKDISQDLNIPNTSAFRLVKQLAARRYLEEYPERPGFYRLGFQILTLSSGLTQVNTIKQLAHFEMDKLAKESGQVAQLGVINGKNVSYIEEVLPPTPVLVYTVPFSVLPINISACGKVITAFSGDEQRNLLLDGVKFERQTENTIVDVNEFIQHLKTVKKQGYALDNEEYAIGVGCIAAPLFDFNSKCVAALGITGGIQNYRGERGEHMLRLLTDACHNISQRLGMPPKVE